MNQRRFKVHVMFFLQTVTFNFENLKLAEQSMLNDAEDEHINLKRSDQLFFFFVSPILFSINVELFIVLL